MVDLFVIFWGSSIQFSIVAIPIYSLNKSIQGFPFLHILTSICHFDDGYSNRSEVISHCGFDLHSPNYWWCWASFHVPVGHLYIFFGKMSLPIFNGIICFLLLSCMSSLYFLDINPLSDIWFANIFSHSVGYVFTLCFVSFVVQKPFSLMSSHLFIFYFVACALGIKSVKIKQKPQFIK